jgi:predicted GNAT family acetyltransferase
MIAVAAWHNGQVIGLSGVSADSDHLWQVGVTVLPEYQQMGIGKALVSRVTEATLEQGKVPHYATWVANLASSNTAHSVGYWLAWTDVYVYDL